MARRAAQSVVCGSSGRRRRGAGVLAAGRPSLFCSSYSSCIQSYKRFLSLRSSTQMTRRHAESDRKSCICITNPLSTTQWNGTLLPRRHSFLPRYKAALAAPLPSLPPSRIPFWKAAGRMWRKGWKRPTRRHRLRGRRRARNGLGKSLGLVETAGRTRLRGVGRKRERRSG